MENTVKATYVPRKAKNPKLKQGMRSSSESSPLHDLLPSEIQALIMEHVRRLEDRERLRTQAEAATRLDGLLDDVVSCLGMQTTSTCERTMSVAPLDIWDVLA